MKIDQVVFDQFEKRFVELKNNKIFPADGSAIIYVDNSLYKQKRCGYFAWYENKEGKEIFISDDEKMDHPIHPKDFQQVVDYLAKKYNFSTEFVCRRNHIPNEETKKILEDIDSGLDKGKIYDNVEEMFRDMGLSP